MFLDIHSCVNFVWVKLMWRQSVRKHSEEKEERLICIDRVKIICWSLWLLLFPQFPTKYTTRKATKGSSSVYNQNIYSIIIVLSCQFPQVRKVREGEISQFVAILTIR